MSRHSFFYRCAASIAPFLLLIAQTVGAVSFTVGNDPAHCSHATLDAALAAVPTNTSGNTIHVVTGTYSQVHLTVNDTVNVAITGGYASCAASAPTSTTTLDGASNGGHSVIHTDGTTILSLSNLVIQNGLQGDDSHGGGIYFNSGNLTLTNTTLTQNTCGLGAGLDVKGDGQTFVDIDANTTITNNVAAQDGGGIRIEGDTVLTISAANTLIANNQAAKGGGLSIIGPARADVSSPGRGANGLFYQNLASGNGGAISVYGSPSSDDPALLRIFAIDANTPPKFNNNRSVGAGAAVYLQSHRASSSHAYLCAQDFDFENNIGDDGTALFADGDDNSGHVGSNIYLNQIGDPDHICLAPGSQFHAIHCTPGSASCNVIKNNHALIGSGAGTPTDGAVVSIGEGGVLKQSNVRYTGNIGGYVLRFKNNEGDLSTTTSCLIGSNAASANVIKSDGDSPVKFDFCTIANNNPGAAYVMQFDDDYDIEDSILSQPGRFEITETDTNSTIVTRNIVATDIFGFNTDPTVVYVSDVLFVDPDHGDYHLQPASQAVDFALAAITDTDLDGQPRVVDLPLVNNFHGAVDLGAFELQSVGNLVLNPDFDTDLRLWDNLDSREVSFDPTQNTVGGSPSGSVSIISMPISGGGGGGSNGPSTLSSLSQCVHLPAFGDYALTGFDRMFGTLFLNGTSFIDWQEFDSSSDCTGTADRSGTLNFPHSSPIAWTHPTPPATIHAGTGINPVFHDATVLLTLGFSPNGSVNSTSFDGISLTHTSSDTIFANGFDD